MRVQSDIVHTFGMIEAQSSSLSSTHNANSNLSFGYSLQTNLIELMFTLVQYLSIGNILNWLIIRFFCFLWYFRCQVDVLEQRCRLLEVNTFQLTQETLF